MWAQGHLWWRHPHQAVKLLQLLKNNQILMKVWFTDFLYDHITMSYRTSETWLPPVGWLHISCDPPQRSQGPGWGVIMNVELWLSSGAHVWAVRRAAIFRGLSRVHECGTSWAPGTLDMIGGEESHLWIKSLCWSCCSQTSAGFTDLSSVNRKNLTWFWRTPHKPW